VATTEFAVALWLATWTVSRPAKVIIMPSAWGSVSSSGQPVKASGAISATWLLPPSTATLSRISRRALSVRRPPT